MANFGAYDLSHTTLVYYDTVNMPPYIDVHNHPTTSNLYTNVANIQQRLWGNIEYPYFRIDRYSIRFDTTNLPVGANIISAKIEIKVTTKYTSASSTWSIAVQNGQPTYPHYTAEAGDYYHGHYSGNGGSIHQADIITGVISDMVLNPTGISWINAGGYTKLILRLDHDINSVPPGEHTEESQNLEEGVVLALAYTRLWIVYEAAEVTTEAVSEVGIDHAKGNGTATGVGITERGFEVRLSFSGTLYEYISHSIAGFKGDVSLVGTVWVGTLIKTITEEGTFSEGAFTGDLGRFPIAVSSNKLFEAETYDYRARATIGGTMYYGDWVEFTTNSYPSGQYPDDQIPITDIIPTEPPVEPIVPWEPVEPVEPPIPEWPEPPEIPWPDFPYPDIPPYDGSWLGWFYYRKAYTKRDLDDLRRKCRIFQDNSVEYALVVNHNSRVLQQFLNSMTDYMGADEHNTFRPIIPTQHLNTLARRPLDIHEFKAIINNFISNSIDNANNVNNNFRLIRDGFSDYAYTEDEGFVDISITTKIVVDNNPDVDRLKKVVDRLNKEMANNYAIINHNLHVMRAILI